MAQAHLLDLRRDPQRLERVVPGRNARLHVAEAAAAGADVAEDHERRGAALPALADVGALGLLADGVEVVVGDRLLQAAVRRAARRRDLEPRRLALAKRAPLDAGRAAGVGARSGYVNPWLFGARFHGSLYVNDAGASASSSAPALDRHAGADPDRGEARGDQTGVGAQAAELALDLRPELL